jgi:serpin B
LIAPGALVPDTRLVITNAVYFKGQWAAPFAEASTTEEDFATARGKTQRVKMMRDHSRASTPYAAFNGDGTFFETPRSVPKDPAKRPPTYPDDAGFSLISLAYKGGELSMVLIAPRSADGLDSVEKQVTEDKLQSWLARVEARTVDTAIPRFTMESSHTMSRTLQAMGMRRAFTDPAEPGGAQFSGMTASQDPSQQLYIGSVLHKAWVDVNEKGTEAAAATAVLMRPTAAAPAEETVPFIPQFRADRPFLFLIRDARTGLVLFMGRLVNPAGL